MEPQKRVKVELIEWRSIDLHLIDSKSTFRPPQSSKRMGTYSACVLGVRLRYQRHGKLVFVAGVFAIVVIVSLPLLMQRHLCHCQASIVALVACCQAGVITLVVMVLLPLMRRRLCCCCIGNCCSCHDGIVAVVDAQASPPLSS
jgi:hypothetical protein